MTQASVIAIGAAYDVCRYRISKILPSLSHCAYFCAIPSSSPVLTTIFHYPFGEDGKLGPSPRRSQDEFAVQLSFGMEEHGSMVIETLCLLLLCPGSPANRVQLPNIPQP